VIFSKIEGILEGKHFKRRSSMAFDIRRGLRALGDSEFLMPSNTIGVAKTRREFSVDLVQNMFLTKKFWSLLP